MAKYLLLSLSLAWAGAAAASAGASASEPEWGSSWESGLREAEDSARPMLVYFHSPECEWSARMNEHWTGTDVRAALAPYVAVRLDAAEHTRVALRERIRNLPTILVVHPAAGTRHRLSGYPGSEALLAFLDESREPPPAEPFSGQDGFEDRLRALGVSRDRSGQLQAFLNDDPFPTGRLIEALEHRSLEVRLGAIEVLEARAGRSFGYDPWTPPDAQAGALVRWRDWATDANAGGRPAAASAFTERQVAGYVTELFASDPDRSRRALAMLMEGGWPVARHLRNLAESNESLSSRERLLLRQARYAAIFQDWSAERPERLSRDLVFGDPGTRMGALGSLARFAPRSLELMEEFLRDPDPLVRESAVERLTAAAGASSLPAVERMWRDETETDVRIGILRAIGEIESQTAVALLTQALETESEDIIILALDYLKHLSDFNHDTEIIGGLLQDPRWRVRSAALEAVHNLSLSDLAGKVAELVRDEDEFVRLSAVAALGRIGGRQQQPLLRELFRESQEWRLPVLEIYRGNNWEIPEEFADRLINDVPAGRENELAALLSELRENQLSFAVRFIDHSNEDFSIAAANSLASRGLDEASHRERLLALLRDGTRGQQLAVLRAFDPDAANLPRIGERADSGSSGGQGNFLQRLFSGGSRKDDPEAAKADHPLAAFEEAAERLRTGGDEGVALEAAIFLTRIGSDKGVDTLRSRLDSMSRDELADLADSLRDSSEPHIREFLFTLFPRLERHTWGIVRRLFEQGSFSENLEFILTHAPSPIPPYYQRFLNDVPDHHRLTGSEREKTRALLRQTFDETDDTALRVFVLVYWQQLMEWEQDRPWILEKTRHPNPLLRRAALRMAVQARPSLLPDLAGRIAGDNDYRVREVLPAAVQRNEGWWSHIYSDAYSASSWSHTIHSIMGGRPSAEPDEERLPPEVERPLRRLTEDPVRNLRLRALVALADVYERIEDPDTLIAYLDAVDSSDRDSYRVESWISGYLYTHFQSMGPEHEGLLRFARNTGYPFQNFQQRLTIDTLRDHFRAFAAPEESPVSEETEEIEIAVLRENSETADELAAGNGILAPVSTEEVAANGTLPVVFFTQTGCADCAQVRDYLARLRPVFPEIEIRSHNIRDTDAIRLNEHLSETFQVPISNRLIAPTVVTAAGVLVRDEISFDSLNRLLGGSWGQDPSILALPEQAVAAVDARIVERFHGFTLAVVLSAGLLDGLNPCAFATIIFFLSYLQVARRTPAQIIQVGFSFVLGVFLAYFAIGVGFYTLIGHLTALEPIARTVNWILAGMVLVICVLSLRDGILCLRGRLKETSLQLPRPLKQRINTLVRTGVRHSHFVIAAFLIGMAIALLELACTGQMYAPTIMLVLQSGAERLAALGYLLIYNIAFILPLVIIILLAWRGLTSDRLMTFFRHHVAFVKFANAALFAVLFAFFIFVLL